MKSLTTSDHPPRRPERASEAPSQSRRGRRDTPLPGEVKLLLVSFRSGEAVRRHPDLQSWLDAGWQIRSATPRVVESGATKLLVVLERPVQPAAAASSPRLRSISL